MFCYAWLGQSYIRFYSHFSSLLLRVSTQLLAKSLCIGAIAFLVFSFLFGNSTIIETLSFLPTFFLFGYYCFFLLICQARQKAKLVAACEVIRTLVNIILVISLHHLFGSSHSLLLLSTALFGSYVIPTFIMIKQTDFSKTSIATSEAINISKTLVSYGVPIAFFLSASLVLSVNDRYFITYLIGKQEAGTYSVIYDVINKGATAIFSPILMTFYPVIATLYNSGRRKEAFEKLKSAIALELGITLLGLLVMIIGTTYFLKIVFSHQMPQSLNLVAILIYIGVCAWQLAMLFHKPLELMQLTKYMAWAVIVCMIVNMTANYIFLKSISSMVVPAITTIISSCLYILIVVLLVKKHPQKLTDIV